MDMTLSSALPSALSLQLLLLLLAPAIGSFLGVVIDRFGRGESLIWARSACRSCGQSLAARDLIPILSFLWARGRCRHCQQAIPAWMFYLELLCLGAALIALAAFPDDSVAAWGWALWLWLLIGLAGCDLRWFRLPDLMTGALFLLSLALAENLTTALWGAFWGAGSFWALRVIYQALRGREGLGLGDVKLMAGLGAFAGVYDLPLLVLMAALLGLGAVAIAALRGHQTGQQQVPPRLSPSLGAQTALPFGAALAVAAVVLWLMRQLGL